MKWYYQFTPHDTHDWDATEPNVLVDTKYRGQTASCCCMPTATASSMSSIAPTAACC